MTISEIFYMAYYSKLLIHLYHIRRSPTLDASADKIKYKSIAKWKAEKFCDLLTRNSLEGKNELKVMVKQAKIDYLQSSVL